MKILKILGTAAQIAAPIAIGAVTGSPEVGATVGAAMLGGKGMKVAGKSEKLMGKDRPHKIAAPAVAVGTGGLAAVLIPGFEDRLREVICEICERPGLVLAIPGLLAVLAHQLGDNVKKLRGDD